MERNGPDPWGSIYNEQPRCRTIFHRQNLAMNHYGVKELAFTGGSFSEHGSSVRATVNVSSEVTMLWTRVGMAIVTKPLLDIFITFTRVDMLT